MKTIKISALSIALFVLANSILPVSGRAYAQQSTDFTHPFGIELGKPLPKEFTYEKASHDKRWLTTSYLLVAVPNPHTLFKTSRHNDSDFSEYHITVSQITGEVYGVGARATVTGNNEDTSEIVVPSCDDMGKLYEQYRATITEQGADKTHNREWLETKGYRGNHQGLSILRYRTGSASKDEEISIEFSCQSGGGRADARVSFHDKAASNRHFEARNKQRIK